MKHPTRYNSITEYILKEIHDIEAFTKNITYSDFSANILIQKAVMMSLINIGELSKTYPEEYKKSHPEIPWNEIRGLRNLAAHQYFKINMAQIWLTVTQDIPTLKVALPSISITRNSPER